MPTSTLEFLHLWRIHEDSELPDGFFVSMKYNKVNEIFRVVKDEIRR